MGWGGCVMGWREERVCDTSQSNQRGSFAVITTKPIQTTPTKFNPAQPNPLHDASTQVPLSRLLCMYNDSTLSAILVHGASCLSPKPGGAMKGGKEHSAYVSDHAHWVQIEVPSECIYPPLPQRCARSWPAAFIFQIFAERLSVPCSFQEQVLLHILLNAAGGICTHSKTSSMGKDSRNTCFFEDSLRHHPTKLWPFKTGTIFIGSSHNYQMVMKQLSSH
jgi:hypothetical protein